MSTQQPRPKRILTPMVLTGIIAVIVFAMMFAGVAVWMLASLP